MRRQHRLRFPWGRAMTIAAGALAAAWGSWRGGDVRGGGEGGVAREGGHCSSLGPARCSAAWRAALATILTPHGGGGAVGSEPKQIGRRRVRCDGIGRPQACHRKEIATSDRHARLAILLTRALRAKRRVLGRAAQAADGEHGRVVCDMRGTENQVTCMGPTQSNGYTTVK